MLLQQMKTVCRCVVRSLSSQVPPSITYGKHNVIMVRHGQSELCHKSPYCGWYDSPLSENGRREALEVAEVLKSYNRKKFDLAFTSVMKRSQESLRLILRALNSQWIPVRKNWRLNGRHFGELTSMSNKKAMKLYDKKMVNLWRDGLNLYPPFMRNNHPCHSSIMHNPAFRYGPSLSEFPKTESLKRAIRRTVPYWEQVMEPAIKKTSSVLVVGHDSSLKAIVKHLDNLSDEEITRLKLPGSTPFLYALDSDLQPMPMGSMQFMADIDKYIKSSKNKRQVSYR